MHPNRILFIVLIFTLAWCNITYAEDSIIIPEALLKQVEQGNAEVAYFIASQYVQKLFDGAESEANEAIAKEWMQKSAEMNYPQATLEWAEILEFDKKYIEALQWYEKASELGISDAKERIASFHLNGRGGLERNCNNAYLWYEKAEVLENKSAYNDHAWELATSAYKSCRNPEKALFIISKLMSLYKNEFAYIPSAILDTQAAVYAGVSDFSKAIEIQKNAIEILGNESDNLGSYQERLEFYKQRKPWVQKLEE